MKCDSPTIRLYHEGRGVPPSSWKRKEPEVSDDEEEEEDDDAKDILLYNIVLLFVCLFVLFVVL